MIKAKSPSMVPTLITCFTSGNLVPSLLTTALWPLKSLRALVTEGLRENSKGFDQTSMAERMGPKGFSEAAQISRIFLGVTAGEKYIIGNQDKKPSCRKHRV